MDADTPTAPRPRKLRRDIHLTDVAREKLRRVWRARTLREPGLTEDEIVNSAIMALPEPTVADPREGFDIDF
jgi:hypothetical protein